MIIRELLSVQRGIIVQRRRSVNLLRIPPHNHVPLRRLLVQVGRRHLRLDDLVGVEDKGGHTDKYLELWVVVFLHLDLLLLYLALAGNTDRPETNL